MQNQIEKNIAGEIIIKGTENLFLARKGYCVRRHKKPFYVRKRYSIRRYKIAFWTRKRQSIKRYRKRQKH